LVALNMPLAGSLVFDVLRPNPSDATCSPLILLVQRTSEKLPPMVMLWLPCSQLRVSFSCPSAVLRPCGLKPRKGWLARLGALGRTNTVDFTPVTVVVVTVG